MTNGRSSVAISLASNASGSIGLSVTRQRSVDSTAITAAICPGRLRSITPTRASAGSAIASIAASIAATAAPIWPQL
jgi:hypothetical protein